MFAYISKQGGGLKTKTVQHLYNLRKHFCGKFTTDCLFHLLPFSRWCKWLMGLPHPRRSHTSPTYMQRYLESTTDWFVIESEKHHLEIGAIWITTRYIGYKLDKSVPPPGSLSLRNDLPSADLHVLDRLPRAQLCLPHHGFLCHLCLLPPPLSPICYLLSQTGLTDP